MFTRTLLAFVLLVCTFVYIPVAHAQTTNVTDMVARMESIMAEMQKLQQEFQALASRMNASTGSGAVLGAATSATKPSTVFTQSLVYGETNDDIKKIQQLLATDPEIYPYGVASGFFGPKTQKAIRNLQTRFGLDPVGVIGPATTALLEGYAAAYPDGNYPDGILSTKPKVLGASTSNPTETGVDANAQIAALQKKLSALTGGGTTGTNPAKSIEASFDDGETWIDINFNDGRRMMRIAVDTEDEDEVVDFVVKKTTLTESQVRALITFEGKREGKKSSSRGDYDAGDAEDALDDADKAIDDARDGIKEADDDGEDIDWADEAYDEARDLYRDARDAFDDEDWDEVVERAEEAADMADEAIDRIGEKKKGSSDAIKKIFAYVGDDEAYIFVEYEDDDDDFTINTEDEDDIISEVADELDLDENEVEDLIKFYGKKVERIEVEIETDESFVQIEFEDGEDKTYRLSEADEDAIIEKLASKLDLPEDGIEDVIDFN